MTGIPRVHIEVLGCPKNEADSRRLMRKLGSRGVEIVDDPEAATHVIVNTCGFIREATEESIEAILAGARSHPDAVLVVMGCMVERYCDELKAEIPEVRHWFGVGEENDLLAVLSPKEARREDTVRGGAAPAIEWVTAPQSYAYVKISEGCDHRCTFCTIPSIRGPYRGFGLEEVVSEARAAVDEGAREIVLVGQDTSLWRDGDQGVGELVERLAEDTRVRRIRFMYFQPEHVDDEILEVVAGHPIVCRYLDIPFQHAVRPVLRRMGRWGDGQTYLELLERARTVMPDVSIRTTFIVGFPGETEEDFAELVTFAEEARLDHAGVFAYSPEEGTAAAGLGPTVPQGVVRERVGELSGILLAMAEERNRSFVGQRDHVLVDSSAFARGRTCRQAPEVDGTVYIDGSVPSGLKPGDVVPVRITEAWGYDLAARWDAP